MTQIAAANASRIAWFLSLQRILDFPKHFLAPTAFASSRRRMPGMAPDVGGSTVSPRYVMTFQGVKSRGTGQSPAQSLHRHAPRASFSAPPEVRNSRSESLAGNLTGAIRWRSNIASMAPSIPNKAFLTYTRPLKSIDKFSGIANHSNRKMEAASSSALAPGNIVSNGLGIPSGSRLRPDDQGSEAIRDTSGGNAKVQDSRETNGSLSAGFRGTESSLARDPSVLLGEPSSQQGDSGTQRSHTSVTTLHIDGSVLGRWAIQHLERALGKPTSGMTGVDPRATVARSRVAPF